MNDIRYGRLGAFRSVPARILRAISALWLTLHAGHVAFTLTLAQPLAAALVVGLMALNCLSVDVGGSIQLVLSSLKVAAIVLIILAGVLLAKPMGGTVDHGLRPSHG